MFACRKDAELLSLPIGEHLSSGEINFVIEKIKLFYNQ
jgi:hypothetical protein